MALLLSLWCLFFLSNVLASSEFQSRCLHFQAGRYYPNSTVTALEFVPANTTLFFPDNVDSCGRPSQLVPKDLCRIAMSLPTSNRSSITFEAWLPRSWSGRFLATGNGGIDGCIKYEDLAYTSSNDFAAVGSNNGHNGTTGITFYNNEDVVTDYAWRSLHTITELGKKLTHTFYEQPHRKSYYLGCSLGGRQGIKASEMFPADYDGIVAGSPAVDFNHLVSWRGSFFPKTGGPGDERFIPQQMWKGLIHNEVLRQCDTIDGAEDGIIEDPTLCHFDPSPLLCASNPAHANSSTCLNTAQLDTVRNVFSPMLDAHGTVLYPPMQPGSEVNAAAGLYNGTPWPYSLDWYRYIIYTPTWNGTHMTPADIAAAEHTNPANIRTFPAQLHAFAARGAKILAFHGLQDNQISSFNSIRFWARLEHAMGRAALDAFYAFFRVSGMNHCSTGPGAWVLGQGGGASAAGIPFEPAQDPAGSTAANVLAALVAWVEHGRAPEYITGTKFVNDSVDAGVAFRRRHCRYPARNSFVGGGREPGDVDAWECRDEGT